MTTAIEKLLSQKIGMDVKSVGQQSFQRVLSQQLKKFGCTLEQYLALLQQSNEAWVSLVEAMVIPETWFFRYPESFNLLGELVDRRQQTNLKPAQLQILCLPCSSGEEAYSIAISLLKYGLSAEQFCIDAIDINSQVLQQAQAGIFKQYSFRSNNLPDIQQFFIQTESSYQLKPEVLACVNLKLGNIFDSATLPVKTYDFIFCRNLLIYFDQDKQNVAVNQLKKLLSADGFLFSGPAEAGAFARSGMSQLTRRDCFAFANASKIQPVALPQKTSTTRSTPSLLKAKLFATKNNNELADKNRSIIKTPIKSIPLSSHQPTPVSISQTDLMQSIEQLSNAGQLQQAFDLCNQALNEFGPSAQLFYLWALLFDSMGNHTKADIYYRKVLYLEPLHTAALKQLAALLHSQGQVAAAKLLEQRIKVDKK